MLGGNTVTKSTLCTLLIMLTILDDQDRGRPLNGARTVFSVTAVRRRSHCRIAEFVVEANHSPPSVCVSTRSASAACWDTMSRVCTREAPMTYARHL